MSGEHGPTAAWLLAALPRLAEDADALRRGSIMEPQVLVGLDERLEDLHTRLRATARARPSLSEPQAVAVERAMSLLDSAKTAVLVVESVMTNAGLSPPPRTSSAAAKERRVQVECRLDAARALLALHDHLETAVALLVPGAGPATRRTQRLDPGSLRTA